jgi:two-component system phosphate regulon sensor histidine kinase PhoR
VASVALLGLIVVQYLWIDNAIKVKEEQLEQQVTKAMTQIVEELAKQETVVNLMEEINYYGSPDNFKRNIKVESNQNNQKTVSPDLMRISNEVAKRIIPRDTSGIYLVESKTLSALDPANLTKSSIQLRYMQKVTDKSIFVKNIINRLITRERPINERIVPDSLRKIIRTNLNTNALPMSFEFAVLSSNQQVVFKSSKFTNSSHYKYFTSQLFPNDVFSTKSYLQIYFPRQANYMIKSIGVLVISSILLTAIIMVIFTVSIFIIFKQKKMSEIRNDFVSNMTHELKTPISTISLAAQMLTDTSIPKERKNVDHLGKVVMDESKRLSVQVEKVLQMARFERGQIKLRLKELVINDLIGNVIVNFRLQLENRNGSIEFVPGEDLPNLWLDEVHFTNIIVNLLENAVKYCKIDPHIVVSTKAFSNGLTIAIQDNGIGISKENQKRIFEQFYRVPTGNVHNVKGFGIGLSYVKTIVENFKGNITVESELNKGSKFIIFLPKPDK